MQRELLEENFAFASPRGTITRWGAGAVKLFGFGADDVAGRSLFDSILRGEDGGWREMLDQESGSARRVVEAELRRADGREFPCEVRFYPVALADGLEFSSFASDLTSDRPVEEREQRLRERHARVVELLEQGSNGNGTVEVEDRLAGIVVTFRSTAEGPITEDELLEDALERTERTEDQAERLAARIDKALSKIAALAGRVDALESAAEAEAAAVPSAEIDELRAAVADAQHRAAAAQREAEAARRALAALRPLPGGDDDRQAGRPPREGFDDAEAPMATLTLSGHFMELNAGFSELVGYSEEEFSSARWPSNVDRARFARHEALRNQLALAEVEQAEIELAYMHREGLMVELSGRIELVCNPDGVADHLLLTLDVR